MKVVSFNKYENWSLNGLEKLNLKHQTTILPVFLLIRLLSVDLAALHAGVEAFRLESLFSQSPPGTTLAIPMVLTLHTDSTQIIRVQPRLLFWTLYPSPCWWNPNAASLHLSGLSPSTSVASFSHLSSLSSLLQSPKYFQICFLILVCHFVSFVFISASSDFSWSAGQSLSFGTQIGLSFHTVFKWHSATSYWLHCLLRPDAFLNFPSILKLEFMILLTCHAVIHLCFSKHVFPSLWKILD